MAGDRGSDRCKEIVKKLVLVDRLGAHIQTAGARLVAVDAIGGDAAQVVAGPEAQPLDGQGTRFEDGAVLRRDRRT